MKRLNTKMELLLTLGAVSLLVLSGCSATEKVDVEQLESDGFQRNVYVSTGIGASRLIPEKSGISTWSVSDKVNAGGQITIGADINRHFSVELHSADLGSAGVEKFGGSQRGRINYHMHGGSALWYIGENRGEHKRRGFTGYGRIGLAVMHNSPEGNAPYSQRNSSQLLFGAGIEYSTKIGLGLRAELIGYDEDAQYAQLGLMYRYGRKLQKPIAALPIAKEKIATPAPVLAVQVAPLDTDKDGVINSLDQCKSTKPGVLVDTVGCAVFNGVLEGVNFFSASERLTPKARSILDGVARTLKKYPEAKINVNAHTDSKGSEFFNQNLSTRRAKMVVLYLGLKGIDRESLVPRAFGESKPIASNDTAEGRALNRRVELHAVK